jgi:uncharacterized membrane protein YjgN (DUF898 family)
MNQMTVPPVIPSASHEVAFTGERGDFRRLVTRGAGLELITAGFYRFWLATDMRRHLWSHTVVDGDAFEYTGRAKELLIGFLIAMAILTPVYVAYFLVGIEAERSKGFASTPLFLFFYMFGQFAIYRARRYRLTRTVWRGVRFWMDGSGWAYALRATLWGLLVMLTLGLALPWREAALERYKMRHSHYGDLQGEFVGTGWQLFKRGWGLWLASPFALLLIPAPFIYGAYKSIVWKWWLEGVRFGEVKLTSTLRTDALIALYWKVIGWVVLAFVALGVYSGAATALYGLVSGRTLQQAFTGGSLTRALPVIVLYAVGYLLTVLTVNVVMRLYLLHDVWQRVASSVSVHRLDAAADVAAKGDLASATGEGLADGLDVAGF